MSGSKETTQNRGQPAMRKVVAERFVPAGEWAGGSAPTWDRNELHLECGHVVFTPGPDVHPKRRWCNQCAD